MAELVETSSNPPSIHASRANSPSGGSDLQSSDANKTFVAPGRAKQSINDLDFIDKLIRQYKQQRAAGPKEGDSKLEMKIDHEAEEILYPEHLFRQQEEPINLLFMKLAYDLNYDVVLYKSERYNIKEPTKEVREQLWGLILGITDSRPTPIKVKTNNFEQGRTIFHALRVRSVFNTHPKLAPKALRKNHEFYGNEPKLDLRTKQVKSRMYLDEILLGVFDDPKDMISAKRVLVQLVSKLGLKEFSEQDQLKCIRDNIVTYDSILDSKRRVPKGEAKPKKRDSKKAQAGKLPEKPSSSPLMTNEEIGTINDLIGGVWNNLKEVNKDFTRAVLGLGYSVLEERITRTLDIRWEVLTNFSNVTTERLRSIKSFEGDSKLTKRKITGSDFSSWYTTRPNARSKWVLELAKIVSPISKLSSEEAKKLFIPNDSQVKAREIAGRATDIRMDQTKAGSSEDGIKPKDGLGENRFSPLDEETVQREIFEKNILRHTQSTEFQIVVVNVSGKTSEISFARSNILTLKEMLQRDENFKDHTNLELLTAKGWSTELARSKSGPTSLIGKMVAYVLERKLITFYSAKAIFGRTDSKNVYAFFNASRGPPEEEGSEHE
jgi:hypothetical protein